MGMMIVGEMISLKKNREFRRAYAKGKSYVSPILVTYVIKNKKSLLRYGITASKKTGNAVKRNRSRRIIRESFRKILPEVKEGYDIIFVARGQTSLSNTDAIFQNMEKHLKKASILK